jgi:hypothetical protein
MRTWAVRIGRSVVGDRRVIAVTAIVLVVVAGLFYARPWTVTKFNLADPGVWVSSENHPGAVHHIDMPVHQQDASLEVDGGAKVAQAGTDAVVWTPTSINGLTPTTMAKGTPVPVEGVTDVKVGGGSVAALGGSNSGITEVYAGTIAGPTVNLSTQSAFSFKGKGALAVGQDGTIAAFSYDSGSLYVMQPGAKGVKFQVPGGTDQLTVVGGKAVLLDPATRSLINQDGTTESLNGWGGEPVLQSVNLATGSAVVATSEGLVSVSEGSQPSWVVRLRHLAKGPAAPVVDAQGCVHGAWSGPAEIIQQCATGLGGSPQLLSEARQPPGLVQTTAAVAGQYEFRVSGSGVVLNDPSSGNSYETVDGATYEILWDSALNATAPTPPVPKQRDPKDSTDIHVQPIKLNAWLGVKASLPVLAEDYDLAGDNLSLVDSDMTSMTPSATATPAAVQPLLRIAADHAHVLLDLAEPNPPVAVGSHIEFQYQVTNGRAGVTVKDGTVDVTVLAPGAAGAPPQHKGSAPVLYIAPQSSTRYFVLNDWWSPQGTPLTVASATISSGSTAVTLPGDGSILVSDYDGGQENVHVTVEDISGVSAYYNISLLPAPGSAPPTVTDDLVSGETNSQLTAYPLTGDRDPLTGGSSSLSITGCQHLGPSSDPRPTCDTTSMSITPSAAGSYSYSYQVVGKSGQQTTGYVRFEVTQSVLSLASVAVRLPVGGMATADLLAGQGEPGKVLAVTRVFGPPSSTGRVTQLIANRYLRVIDSGSSINGQTLNFTVSDGGQAASAQVFIVPVLPDPTVTIVAPPKSVQVVQGNVATVRVLDTDYSEMGWPLKIVNVSEPSQGRAWTDGSVIRYEPGSVGPFTISYQVEDVPLTGEVHDAYGVVHMLVTPPPSGLQAIPKPEPLEVRVAADGSVSLPVPLQENADGTPIDPAGLAVTPLTVSQQGNNGEATLNGDILTYRSSSLSGAGDTDTFQYEVRDSLGNVGTGRVNVIVFPSSSCDPPTAAPVRLSVALGSSPVIPVLISASDPCDGTLSVAEVAGPDQQALDAKMVAAGVAIHVPTVCGTPCSWSLTYRVRTGTELSASATISVEGVPAGPRSGIAPTASDIFPNYPPGGQQSVTIPVGSYIANPGDPAQELVLTLAGTTYGATVDPGRLTVTVALQKATVPLVYLVQDPVTQLTATAVIWLPGLGNPTPLYSVQAPIPVQAGGSTSIQLTKYFAVPSGYELRADTLKSNAGPEGGTVSLSGTLLEVTIPGSANSAFASQPLSLEAAGGAEVPTWSAFALRLQVIGKNAPQAVPCSTTAYPTSTKVVDLASCVIPGSAQLSDLTFSARQSFVTIGGAGTNDPQARITPSSGASGPLGVDVDATDPASGKFTTIHISVTVVKPDLQITTAPYSPIVKVGQTIQVDMTNLVTVIAPAGYQGDRSYTVTAESTSTDAVTATASATTVGLTGKKHVDQTVVVTYTVITKEGGQGQGTILVTIEGPPTPPTNPGAKDISDSTGYKMQVSWSTPQSDGGVTVTDFLVTASSGGTCHPLKGATECAVTGLQAHTSYTFTIVAINAVDQSQPAATPSVQTAGPPDTPGAPTMVAGPGGPGTGSAVVRWSPSPPTGNVGDAVTGYVITTQPPSPGCSTPDGATYSCIDSGLAYGTSYIFFVTAKNNVAQSIPARSPLPYLPSTVPDQPTGVHATPEVAVTGDTNTTAKVDVNWAPWASNEGSTITKYVVTSSPDGITCTALGEPANSCIFGNQNNALQFGTSYTFSVQAFNDNGPSIPSDSSSNVTPIGPPSVPGTPQCSATGLKGSTATLDCKWSPSTSDGDGGNDVTYTLTANDGNASKTCPPLASSVSSCSIDLATGPTYTFTVSAKNGNSNVDSGPSTQASWKYTAPLATCSVAITAPATTGDATVTVFGDTPGASTIVVTDLTNGTTVLPGAIALPALTTILHLVASGDKLSLQARDAGSSTGKAFTTTCA